MSPSEDLQDTDVGQDMSCTLQGMGPSYPGHPQASATHFKPQFKS